MPTNDEIEAAARGMYGKHWDGPPDKMPGPKMKDVWRHYAKAALEGAEEYRRSQCRHPRKTSQGWASSDGSSETTWHCPDCLASGKTKTPPRPDGGATFLMNPQ